MSKVKSIPYAGALAGDRARQDISDLLRDYGAEKVGWMDEFETNTLILFFRYRERDVQLKASANGWASLYLKHNPWRKGRHTNKETWERKALAQGMIAVSSILRDWVKGQIIAIESGILTFENVFLPYMITENGQTVSERMGDMEHLLMEANKEK